MSARVRLGLQRKQFNNRNGIATIFCDGLKITGSLLCLICTNSAIAQLSGTASLVSDYRFRGVSLSEGNPEAQASLGYDTSNGWYIGGMLSGAKLVNTNTQQIVTYAGYADLITPGLSWEAGGDNVTFTRASDYNYNELFFGLASDNCSARIYYSPSYFEQNTRTVYAELNGAWELQENLQLLTHIGWLRPFSDGQFTSRYDLRFGVNAKISDWNVQLAWIALQVKTLDYPQYEDLHSRTFVLSAIYHF